MLRWLIVLFCVWVMYTGRESGEADYYQGQVLMAAMEAHPERTADAMVLLVEYLGDGRLTQREQNDVMRLAGRGLAHRHLP